MTRFDLASKTHPFYTFADDVTMPEGFTDISDINRYGPEFRHVSDMCAVYFNYPYDNSHISRYVVSTTLDQRGIDSGEARHYWYKCVTWAEVLGHIDTWRKRTGHEVHPPTKAELLGALDALVEIIEDDHYKCDINSDEDCDLLKSEREIRHQHGRLREAKQAIAKAKGGA